MQVPSLSADATLEWLRGHAWEHLRPIDEWKPGEAVLCVIEERLRRGVEARFKFKPRFTPSLAIFFNPEDVQRGVSQEGLSPGSTKYTVYSKAKMMLCALDPATKKPNAVRVQHEPKATAKIDFDVPAKYIFAVPDIAALEKILSE